MAYKYYKIVTSKSIFSTKTQFCSDFCAKISFLSQKQISKISSLLKCSGSIRTEKFARGKSLYELPKKIVAAQEMIIKDGGTGKSSIDIQLEVRGPDVIESASLQYSKVENFDQFVIIAPFIEHHPLTTTAFITKSNQCWQMQCEDRDLLRQYFFIHKSDLPAHCVPHAIY